MEITIIKEPVDGMLNLNVRLYEFTDNFGKTVELSIWVPDNDSRSALRQAGRSAAIDQLKRALSALENEDH